MTQKFPVVLAIDTLPREFLVAEKVTVGKITKPDLIPSALLAVYYVFNIAFPDNLKQFYLVLQQCLNIASVLTELSGLQSPFLLL